jgi:Flp pilus assembly protein protease CpaA
VDLALALLEAAVDPLTTGINVGAAVLATLAGYYDLRTRAAPNWLTLSTLGGALLWRGVAAWRFQAWRPLMWGVGGCVVLQILWAWGGLGGADAKLFGALWLLWPTATWLVVWLVSLILGYVAHRIARGRGPLPALGPGALAAWFHIGYLFVNPISGGVS